MLFQGEKGKGEEEKPGSAARRPLYRFPLFGRAGRFMSLVVLVSQKKRKRKWTGWGGKKKKKKRKKVPGPFLFLLPLTCCTNQHWPTSRATHIKHE